MFKIEDGRDRFYQWDLNRKLIVEDNTIPQVHFSNAIGDTAYVVNAVDGVAPVPNILLQQDCPLLVYGYDGEATKHTATFEVVGRNKPEDYIYSEEEIKNYDALEKRIEELEKGGGGSGSDISLGITSANPGQTVKVLEIDNEGKPTKWEAVEFPETTSKDWELINYIEFPEDAEESSAITFDKDSNGEPFRLVKAKIFAGWPKYTGSSTPPNLAFCMINGRTSGGGAMNPLGYTTAWNVPNTGGTRCNIWEVDCSGTIYVEKSYKANHWGVSSGGGIEFNNNNNVYDTPKYRLTNFDIFKPITSIGCIANLFFPGCKIWLYGVRE